ncbi:sugar transferase [Thermodesulfobacteriota bacterium]
MGLFAFSRLHIFGTIILLLLAELSIFAFYYLGYARKSDETADKKEVDIFQKQRISTRLLISDFLLINFSFFVVNYFKRGNFQLKPGYEKLLLAFYGLWIITALITRKFDKDSVHDLFNAIGSCFKSAILIAAIMAVLVFALRLHYYSRMQIFGALAIFFFLEIFLYGFYVVSKKEKSITKDVESIEQVKAYYEKETTTFDFPDVDFIPEDPVKDNLKTALDFFNPWLFKFIHNHIDLLKISNSNTYILSTEDVVSLKTLDNSAFSLIINLYRLNHFRRVNQYFLEIHRKLKNSGYLMGKVNTIRLYQEKVKEKYPRYLSNVLYALHFIFYRIFPKLPFAKQIYFAITQGRNRIISKAEVLGRLQFCGFEIIAEQEIDYDLYFIARKVKAPSTINSPSYGPLVKLNRFGTNGQLITVYKFRTMHPYSEFIQEYTYRQSNLQEGGKFNNDFRVTGWGKFMRKFWLDELPMLYNWIRGDLQLIGVRPLSSQYLSLYSKDLQEMRKKVKPGLIPPFYADLPETFDEICESEMKYLQAYLMKPIKTQFIYLWRALYNILIKGVRSQ